MESLPKKLLRTREALSRQTHTLVGRTAEAGRVFAGDTAEAGRAFARFVDREARGWVGYAAARRKDAAGLANGARTALAPVSVERRALLGLQLALAQLQARVDHRITALDGPARVEPLADYDTLSARAIVAKLADLSAEQIRSLHQIESESKRRATVLRALEQRLAN